MRAPSLSLRALLFAPLLLLSACTTPLAHGPSKGLRLRHVVLYQNGLGYFERTGEMSSDKLALRFREREVDDVLKSVVVVEEGLGPNETPSTVSAHLPRSGRGASPEEATELELVFSPRPSRPVSIAYAVPTAAWKATYRIILPTKEQKDRRALLQAWALIDNVGDEDWNDVRVTLATGAPLSYSSDLRSPTMIERPELKGIYGPQGGAVGPVLAENVAARDTDADGVPDREDVCPNERGTVHTDPARTGCPSHVRVSSTEIHVLTQVLFDKGSDTVKPTSQVLLDQVAQALLENPVIALLEIEGHTSTDETKSLDLATRRAAAVRSALVKRGVPPIRLSMRSYGADRPVDSNATEQGRAKNRRVAFRVAEQVRREATQTTTGTFSPITTEALARVPEGAGRIDASSGSYRYEIANPVTLAKKSSALITLINRPMSGDDVLLYRPDPAAPQSSTHPFRAAEIENKSDIGLQPGSVSIFSGGTFVGEGVITRLLPGERSTIPYAIDDSTRVSQARISLDEPVRIVALARGVLRVTDRQRLVTTYDVEPGHNVPNTLVLRHPRTFGYEPVVLPEGTEKTPDAYLIRVALTPHKPTKIAIEEARPVERQWLVLTADGERLALYLKGSALPEGTQKRMARIVELRRTLGAANDELGRLREKRQEATDRAVELRENVKAIEKTPQADKLRKMLLERLESVTKAGDELAVKITQRSDDAAIARAELDDAVRDLVIEEDAKADGGKP
ncbi:OmpA family protein [Polyangium mundeleinium]|uniref:OmpA family protein n=1 Tax=Polyangium mundeleinium TaxID=2995306 RepID=A0ABT5EDG7_9BACT|nr:OmpA family protein [Polyangium mundeleinium]MDC0739864.1 OmpA family protein [Polyangium mundeleinium]